MKDLPKVPDLVKPQPQMDDGKNFDSTRPARPWDLFNKNIGRVENEIKESRMAICRECPFFLKVTGQCKECGCFMEAKTRLPNAVCPKDKWGAVDLDTENIPYKKEEE